eukprot:CAMPEP_0178676718 /NCGR_PEP_ID=MMETSP0698-20121128/36069_1 /TAXON_ID=265572 /ORGANISM="Extubocellulus spinifer, Strain CCMP396" /LENGTH=50 /DNA_ID=CAMNT_0020320983 /DNA_START=286 /DNA_END=434 /DNA_ORIENTATION=-
MRGCKHPPSIQGGKSSSAVDGHGGAAAAAAVARERAGADWDGKAEAMATP